MRGQGDVPGVKYEISDYSKKLPEGTPDLVLSALSIHHLEHEKKKSLFKSIHNSLSEGGTFLNYDQFCCENDTLNTKTEEYWIEGIKNSGLSEKEFDRWLERKKLDRQKCCGAGNCLA
ncbi:MAG: class I SAM-dependent methyltransferase [Treponema porcinum]|uniref:class I SAM-dependent methyltransferase n=1 Tax=Treponema porcinum TaxID=261392 RepID=UPI002353D6D9|nr:class I SAM-dependent methyltransferase [Treponema porcinum]MCI6179677.1 class I SAM-dependent methyltransferase [Treponema porcinum]MCI6321714.1 class I SAM-dependent methyltransferase [Treponema porcinum]MCI6982685.1 class I SAM-dependent methyltransferase [Treponema porcinum]MCI7534061.1 class I SAM-dependent methyltransferase [Treponema porcinum]MCI7546268.1 class I SAM-dependent methyltransferase [Treponema porcinum]